MKKTLFLFLALVVISCKKDAEIKTTVVLQPGKTFQKDGLSVNLYDYKSFEHYLKKENDTTYVINFWATWCQPCVEELPYFERLNQAYKDQKVKVILVSLDMKKEAESKLIPFIKKRNLQSTVLLLSDPDANSWIEKIDTKWSGAIPATIIYNKNKRQFYEQSFTYETLETALKQFIN